MDCHLSIELACTSWCHLLLAFCTFDIFSGSFPVNQFSFQVLVSKEIVSKSSFANLLASLTQLLPPHSPVWVIQRQTALCAELLLPDCVRFSSCSSAPDEIAARSTSTAAPRLHQLQLLLAACVRFNCCSPIVSALAAAPRQLFWKIPALSTILEHSTQSSRFSKCKDNEVRRSRVTIV